MKRLRLGIACTAVLAYTACGVLSPEEQLLTEFFEAARAYDTSVMARLSAHPMNPRVVGIVDSFEIEQVERGNDGRERVTVDAQVRAFAGGVTSRQFVFTLTQTDGRWFIEEWRGAP